MSKFDLHQMRQFLTIMRAGSFRKAAERLAIAQPALSNSMKQLEDELGADLFLRTKKGIILTEAGEALAPIATQCLLYADHGRQTIKSIKEQSFDAIRIGYVGPATFQFLPEKLRKFREISPETKFSLHHHSSPAVVEALQNHDIDVGFIYIPVNADMTNFKIHSIERIRLGALMSTHHKFSKKHSIDIKEIKNEPMIAYAPTTLPSIHAALLDVCISSGFMPTIVHEVRNEMALVGLVSSGVGISLVPEGIAHVIGNSICLIPLNEVAPSQLMLAMIMHEVNFNKKCCEFWDFCSS
jgi:DNA-binding transcriptional LysR family regulator